MKLTRNIILTVVLFVIVCSYPVSAQVVRIMPMGNSITYDHNSFDESDPRPSAERISYRYKLYQLLKQDGLHFDFVGSEDGGYNYFDDPELDDNAGFPGIESWELANLINTGYNGYSGGYVSPGPYLNYFPTDIILLHIGTNNLKTSAADVETVLNNIRAFDSDVIILVARIINREVYHAATTTFNNNVEIMVNSRGDSRIKTVNIESGAGINYATEMVDTWHPSQSGYDKMAYKWFDAIMALNSVPVVSAIPVQTTDKGESFTDISLDPYVTDAEDPDFLMVWTYEQLPDSKLSISIDASRIMHVSPDPTWSGSETIKLKASDTGNGAFVRSDSVYVTFNVDHVNSPPVFTSSPITIVDQGDEYSYTLSASDVDEDVLSYSSIQVPAWLDFNATTRELSGTPADEHVGIHTVILKVTDGMAHVHQQFDVQVIDTNDPPVMTSPSEIDAYEDQYFTMTITAVDADGDPVSYQVSEVPSWLNYSLSNHSLSGKPSDGDIGDHIISVMLSDGSLIVYYQLTITVQNVNDLPVFTSDPVRTAGIGQSYIYRVTATDPDPETELNYSYLNIPDWLNFLESSTDALLYGTPAAGDAGSDLVILKVSDGLSEVLQGFTIEVSGPNSAQDMHALIERVYPNPAGDWIHFDLKGSLETKIIIVNVLGGVQMEYEFEEEQPLEIDLSMLPEGIYFYKARQNGMEATGKFIKQ